MAKLCYRQAESAGSLAVAGLECEEAPAAPAELASTLPRCSSQAAQIRSEWRELMATTRSLSSSGNLADLGIKP